MPRAKTVVEEAAKEAEKAKEVAEEATEEIAEEAKEKAVEAADIFESDENKDENKTEEEKAMDAVELGGEGENPDVPAEAEVPVDVELPPETIAEATKKRKAKSTATYKEPRLINENRLGVLSDDLIEESEEASDKEKLEILKRAAKAKTILYGTVGGVKTAGSSNNVLIDVYWNGIKITIRDREYFESTFDFGPRYDEVDEGESKEDIAKKRCMIRKAYAKYQLMAVVPFVILDAQMMTISEGFYAGQKVIAAVGSKVEAMRILRDHYFLQENPKKSYPKVPKKGNLAEARVLYTKPDHVLVECLGVETRIPVIEISDDYVPNCQDVVSVGDTMKVKIEKIYINDDKSVYLTVTGKTAEPNKAIANIRVGDSYLGTVKMYNPAKHRYQISLKNGVSCTVRDTDVQGKLILHPGNLVSVYVVKKHDTFISGSAVKLK